MLSWLSSLPWLIPLYNIRQYYKPIVVPGAPLKIKNENNHFPRAGNKQTTDQNKFSDGQFRASSSEIFKGSFDYTLVSSFALTLKSNYYVSYDSTGLPVHPKVVIKN